MQLVRLQFLTKLLDTGHFSRVKGQFEVGLCPLSEPLFFLFNTQLIGLKAFQLETGVLPYGSECREALFQHLLSIHTNSDLRQNKMEAVVITSNLKEFRFKN